MYLRDAKNHNNITYSNVICKQFFALFVSYSRETKPSNDRCLIFTCLRRLEKLEILEQQFADFRVFEEAEKIPYHEIRKHQPLLKRRTQKHNRVIHMLHKQEHLF